MNVMFIGYRGTGKSSVARLVAEQLGWKWVDVDLYVEEQTGQTIREIFEKEGESGFRDRESLVIRELTARIRLVIATGGGAVLRPENCAAMKRSGLIVWLVASPKVICQRLSEDPATFSRRPELTVLSQLDEIQELLAQREPLYRACSDFIVSTDGRSLEQVADEILQALAVRMTWTQVE